MDRLAARARRPAGRARPPPLAEGGRRGAARGRARRRARRRRGGHRRTARAPRGRRRTGGDEAQREPVRGPGAAQGRARLGASPPGRGRDRRGAGRRERPRRRRAAEAHRARERAAIGRRGRRPRPALRSPSRRREARAGPCGGGRAPPDAATTPATCGASGSTTGSAWRRPSSIARSAAGQPVVFLLHGHGTGALRDAIRKELARSPYVARFRGGEPGSGRRGRHPRLARVEASVRPALRPRRYVGSAGSVQRQGCAE